jgi:hypothetical protein
MLSKAAFLFVMPALYAQSIEGVVINSVTRAPVIHPVGYIPGFFVASVKLGDARSSDSRWSCRSHHRPSS